MDISIIDKDNIWLGTEDNKILRTQDGGDNWQVQIDATSITNFIDYIKMFDLQNGVVVADAISPSQSVIILTTNDGGLHWNSVNTQSFGGLSPNAWKSIDFVDPQVGYFFESGVDPQKLYKTVDGGAHWDTTNYSSVSNTAQLIKFYNENIGLTYTLGNVYYTLNGGQNWETSLTQGIDFLFGQGWGEDIAFINDNNSLTIALVTAYNIYFSADTGKTWTDADTSWHPSSDDIIALSFPDKDHGWILSANSVYYKSSTLITTGLEDNSTKPQNFAVYQNYPNPFNPSTKITYSLRQKGFVTIKVFDMLGREVSNLINEEQSAGQHEVNFKADNLPSGIYFYRINTGSSAIVKKMILLK
jgi:photosystem II stability/assembly factor-like uncharacterized protein